MGLLDIEPLDDKLAMLFVTQSGKKAVENYVQPSNTEKEEAEEEAEQEEKKQRKDNIERGKKIEE